MPCATVQYRMLLVIPYITILLPPDILTIKSNSTIDHLKIVYVIFYIRQLFVVGSTNDWFVRRRRTNIPRPKEYCPT